MLSGCPLKGTGNLLSSTCFSLDDGLPFTSTIILCIIQRNQVEPFNPARLKCPSYEKNTMKKSNVKGICNEADENQLISTFWNQCSKRFNKFKQIMDLIAKSNLCFDDERWMKSDELTPIANQRDSLAIRSKTLINHLGQSVANLVCLAWIILSRANHLNGQIDISKQVIEWFLFWSTTEIPSVNYLKNQPEQQRGFVRSTTSKKTAVLLESQHRNQSLRAVLSSFKCYRLIALCWFYLGQYVTRDFRIHLDLFSCSFLNNCDGGSFYYSFINHCVSLISLQHPSTDPHSGQVHRVDSICDLHSLWASVISGLKLSVAQRNLLYFCLPPLMTKGLHVASDSHMPSFSVARLKSIPSSFTFVADTLSSIKQVLVDIKTLYAVQNVELQNEACVSRSQRMVNQFQKIDKKPPLNLPNHGSVKCASHCLALVSMLGRFALDRNVENTIGESISNSLMDLFNSAFALLNTIQSEDHSKEVKDLSERNDGGLSLEWSVELACCSLICELADCIGGLKGAPLICGSVRKRTTNGENCECDPKGEESVKPNLKLLINCARSELRVDQLFKFFNDYLDNRFESLLLFVILHLFFETLIFCCFRSSVIYDSISPFIPRLQISKFRFHQWLIKISTAIALQSRLEMLGVPSSSQLIQLLSNWTQLWEFEIPRLTSMLQLKDNYQIGAVAASVWLSEFEIQRN